MCRTLFIIVEDRGMEMCVFLKLVQFFGVNMRVQSMKCRSLKSYGPTKWMYTWQNEKKITSFTEMWKFSLDNCMWSIQRQPCCCFIDPLYHLNLTVVSYTIFLFAITFSISALSYVVIDTVLDKMMFHHSHDIFFLRRFLNWTHINSVLMVMKVIIFPYN